MNDITQLVPFSVGLVIADSVENSYYIRVIPIEQQGFIHGEIEDGSNVDNVKGKDSQGNEWETSYTTTNALTAKWISRDSNRRTPPSIHKGERVQLYKYADSDDVFWEDNGQDTRNRTTEREVKVWSNKPKRDGEELSAKNAYFLEVDTNTGLVTFKTNKSNGEPFSYTFQLQTKKGIFVVEDDVGNSIAIDSSKKEVILENQSKSFIQLLDKDITINATDNLNIKVGKNMVTTVGSKMTTTAATASLKLSGAYSIKTSSMDLTGAFKAIGSSMTHNGVNVGSVHSHIGNLGKPVSPPF